MIDKVGEEEVARLLSNYPFSQEIIVQANHAWCKLELNRGCDGTVIERPEFSSVTSKVYELYGMIDSYVIGEGNT